MMLRQEFDLGLPVRAVARHPVDEEHRRVSVPDVVVREGHIAVVEPLHASKIARQMRSGVHGRSTWRTPRCDSASTTAFCTATVDPMAPACPMPFAPRALTGDA